MLSAQATGGKCAVGAASVGVRSMRKRYLTVVKDLYIRCLFPLRAPVSATVASAPRSDQRQSSGCPRKSTAKTKPTGLHGCEQIVKRVSVQLHERHGHRNLWDVGFLHHASARARGGKGAVSYHSRGTLGISQRSNAVPTARKWRPELRVAVAHESAST